MIILIALIIGLGINIGISYARNEL